MRPVFLDTNILVYAYDRRELRKYKQATKWLEQQLHNHKIVISSQVVSEFCNVMTTKQGMLMTTADLQGVIQEVLSPLLEHLPSVEFYQRAVELQAKNSLSFYDALIIQAGLDLDCSILYSEDLQDGQEFDTLKIINPFVS